MREGEAAISYLEHERLRLIDYYGDEKHPEKIEAVETALEALRKAQEFEYTKKMLEAAIAGQETLQKKISEWVKECEELQERLIDCEKAVAKQIFAEIEKIIDEKYNRDVFRSEYDDTEVEAIINFSDSISIEIYDLKEKYIGSEEQL